MSYYANHNSQGGFYQPSQQFQFPQGAMSFDPSGSGGLSNSSPANFTNEQLPNGIINALSTRGYSFEPPLLEELGINFGHILTKTKFVLTPTTSVNLPLEIFNDTDLSGPLLFCLVFGTMLLTAGKVHFGYIYGVALFGSLSLYQLLRLMSQPVSPASQTASPSATPVPHASNAVSFLKTASILGYSFLPLCFLATVGVFCSLNNWFGYILGLISVVWCTWSSSGFFIYYLQLHNVRVLIAYPLLIFYSVFALMAIFV
ncbi:AAL135Cp [Eremothecium gossypii ATCC 10895]|uniref:Protein YIP n=1 Tax=Eremothecium gossypii (strain ATCC 10895 / CBS 109.51 / FGSC 9923 / NRRL Y-1056) TaxID=284811 RepID=Q75F63_EREGS|nr:AAL135Cp [Eremothecium gossypii ATCC 10895]AAS50231.1 AAL135Cp [Eremothecium gossypii ATCC 10895]AEY94516.1 FAAL135Cp [Eremothecium gossypii FDAG1]